MNIVELRARLTSLERETRHHLVPQGSFGGRTGAWIEGPRGGWGATRRWQESWDEASELAWGIARLETIAGRHEKRDQSAAGSYRKAGTQWQVECHSCDWVSFKGSKRQTRSVFGDHCQTEHA